MVNTVGRKGRAGEHVRCIVSVNMLSEGWDVQSVSHILGLRAFGSPLLTEQIIGRGLRRTNYDVLNQPIEERPEGSEETVDAFGIPFVGFPVEKRKRPKAGEWGHKPEWIEVDQKKEKYRLRIPNVRSWAVGVIQPLHEVIRVRELAQLVINPKETPPEVTVRPVVGGKPEAVLTLDEFRKEYPLLRTTFLLAKELLDATSPGETADLGIGPTFDELLRAVQEYLEMRVIAKDESDIRDIGIYYWRQQVLDRLETAIRNSGLSEVKPVPILGNPDYLDTANMRRFQWTGILTDGKKCHTRRIPCHTELEKRFTTFLDNAADVLRYLKNERFGFSVTYYENNRPRQYFPDFIVAVREPGGREVMWLVETKGEIRSNTELKRQAANLWCEKMSKTSYGSWRHLFVEQRKFEYSIERGVKTFVQLAEALVLRPTKRQLSLIPLEDVRVNNEAFKTLLPLYTLQAAAGYFGNGHAVEQEAWVEAAEIGRLDERMFVARAVGRSMEPRIYEGDFLVFRSNPVGSRQGKIVLVQYRGPADPETGGSFTVKRYRSEKAFSPDGSWRHTKIMLEPLNPEFQPIVFETENEGEIQVIAEYLGKLGRTS
jgi:SOS-response transcriptional repressor LexA